MSRPTFLLAVLLVLACKQAEAPTSATAPAPPPAAPTTAAAEPAPAPAAPAASPSEKAWKVQPTPLSVIKADPPSYLDKPTLVFVAVKPTDYFNYGYNRARNSHFGFEMRSVENGQPGAEKLYGYAARSWARPFFEAVNQRRGMFVLTQDAAKNNYVTATLVVAYSKKRYDGRSADHIEILAADVGEKFDMDPVAVMQAASGDGVKKAASGATGDCGVWRQLRRLATVSLHIPRHCGTYPEGTALRVFDTAARLGFSRPGQLCVAWRFENRVAASEWKGPSEMANGLRIVEESCQVDEDAGQVQDGMFPE